MEGDFVYIEEKEHLLTGSNGSGSTGTGSRGATTQGGDITQPAESQFVTTAVEVGLECAGCIPGADLAGIWWVTNRQDRLEPARGRGDGTTVHPDIEAGAATVGTVTTFANTTEGQSGDVESGIVDRDTTGASGRDDWGLC